MSSLDRRSFLNDKEGIVITFQHLLKVLGTIA